MAELREELERALDRMVEDIVLRVEHAGARTIGAVPCPGDHGAALPCELCGAVL